MTPKLGHEDFSFGPLYNDSQDINGSKDQES